VTDVTNLFPNPNAVTLVSSRPKYFQGFSEYMSTNPEYEGYPFTWSITQTTVSGDTRVLNTQTAGGANNLNLVLGEGTFDGAGAGTGSALGLVNGTDYIISAVIYPPTADPSDVAALDPWAYIGGSSDGYSEHPLIGPGPWRVWGSLQGTFGGDLNLFLTCWGFDNPVEVDKVMIYPGAVIKRMPWDMESTIPAGSPVDGAALGMVPGKSYVATGYTHGTFKVRTGTSSGTATDLVSWTNLFPGDWTGGAHDGVFTIPEGHTYISLEATTTEAWIGILEYVPFFDGNTTDGGGYTYSWSGTPNDSASVRSVATSGGSITAKIFVGSTAVNITEMGIVVGSTLTPITEIGT